MYWLLIFHIAQQWTVSCPIPILCGSIWTHLASSTVLSTSQVEPSKDIVSTACFWVIISS